MLRKEQLEHKFRRELLAALRGIEEHVHTIRTALTPVKKEENTDRPDDATDNKEAFPKPQVAIKIVTEASQKDAEQHKTKQDREYALQWEAFRVQRYLLWATILAFGAAAYYAWTADRTLKEIHIQNVAQQRGIIDISVNERYTSTAYLAIRIANTGHVPATLINGDIAYRQEIIDRPPIKRGRTVHLDRTIGAGTMYTLGVSLPSVPVHIAGRIDQWSAFAYFRITYDDGFANQQALRTCFRLDPTTRLWDASCTWINPIDLSKDSADSSKNQ